MKLLLLFIVFISYSTAQSPPIGASTVRISNGNLIFGGKTIDTVTNTLYFVSDAPNSNFTVLENKADNPVFVPNPAYRHCCVSDYNEETKLSGNMYCYGGVNSPNLIYKFDTLSMKWVNPISVAENFRSRAGHQCFLSKQGVMYVYGGIQLVPLGAISSSSLINAFNTESIESNPTNVTAGFVDTPLDYISNRQNPVLMTSPATNQQGLLLFGEDPNSSEIPSVLPSLAFVPLSETGFFKPLKTSVFQPQFTTGTTCTSVFYNDIIDVYCFGGKILNSTLPTNQFWTLNSTLYWNDLSFKKINQPTPRDNALMLQSENLLLIWGGGNAGFASANTDLFSKDQPTNDQNIYRFDLASQSWLTPVPFLHETKTPITLPPTMTPSVISNVQENGLSALNIALIVFAMVFLIIMVVISVVACYYKKKEKINFKKSSLDVENTLASQVSNNLLASSTQNRHSDKNHSHDFSSTHLTPKQSDFTFIPNSTLLENEERGTVPLTLSEVIEVDKEIENMNGINKNFSNSNKSSSDQPSSTTPPHYSPPSHPETGHFSVSSLSDRDTVKKNNSKSSSQLSPLILQPFPTNKVYNSENISNGSAESFQSIPNSVNNTFGVQPGAIKEMKSIDSFKSFPSNAKYVEKKRYSSHTVDTATTKTSEGGYNTAKESLEDFDGDYDNLSSSSSFINELFHSVNIPLRETSKKNEDILSEIKDPKALSGSKLATLPLNEISKAKENLTKYPNGKGKYLSVKPDDYSQVQHKDLKGKTFVTLRSFEPRAGYDDEIFLKVGDLILIYEVYDGLF
ncbi:hypothetical protein HDU92_007153 [Lobulomyces angularis]|nr:hypothetical protein HDU92_007153 [Lobulomyces angularis]